MRDQLIVGCKLTAFITVNSPSDLQLAVLSQLLSQCVKLSSSQHFPLCSLTKQLTHEDYLMSIITCRPAHTVLSMQVNQGYILDVRGQIVCERVAIEEKWRFKD